LRLLLAVKALVSLVTVWGASELLVQTTCPPLGTVMVEGWKEYLLLFSTILTWTTCVGVVVVAVG